MPAPPSAPARCPRSLGSPHKRRSSLSTGVVVLPPPRRKKVGKKQGHTQGPDIATCAVFSFFRVFEGNRMSKGKKKGRYTSYANKKKGAHARIHLHADAHKRPCPNIVMAAAAATSARLHHSTGAHAHVPKREAALVCCSSACPHERTQQARQSNHKRFETSGGRKGRGMSDEGQNRRWAELRKSSKRRRRRTRPFVRRGCSHSPHTHISRARDGRAQMTIGGPPSCYPFRLLSFSAWEKERGRGREGPLLTCGSRSRGTAHT